MVIEKRRLKRFLSRTSIYENSVLLLVGKDESGKKRESKRQGEGVDRHRVRDLPGLDALVAREPLKRVHRRNRMRRLGYRPRHH